MEKETEVAHFLDVIARTAKTDLEAWEFSLRRAVLATGARVLEGVLENICCGRREEPIVCVSCGQRMDSVGVREKTIQTVLGPVRLRRSLYICPGCKESRVPGDELLDVEQTGLSPGARRLTVHAGSRTSFIEAEEDLQLYAELKVDRREIERVAEAGGRSITEWMKKQDTEALAQTKRSLSDQHKKDIPMLYVSFDGTGIPMRKDELQGRRGKGPQGESRTREVKLGCVFTQTTCDKEDRPVRDPESTTYAGAIEDSDSFGWRIYAEATRRGLDRAMNVVVLTDGAGYNKSIAQTHFPNATHIIDLYHAREHVSDMAKLLVPQNGYQKQVSKWLTLLDEGKIEKLITLAGRYLPRSGERRKKGRIAINYLRNNADSMRYADFRARGFFVGSGVVEAGCRTVIGQRLKKSGMFWSVAGANAIIAARCCLSSRRFNDFWEDRAA